ncbi:TIGR02281 family clan AA aspartic protease [Thalassotalea sp. M1531]|uniref:TIGR02281 family clan AA aspartic protease n=1 Tax=Thalassotalea algicola TaxID=2716224 RepID=A0A7Y0LD99_9GAMM|nr:TIGR02281 family clan AA aspartic protease [Thalassotalea algicola]NMP32069.1 TIGR02281 family clan AA aspartic protease [Thalassotalea algicola]
MTESNSTNQLGKGFIWIAWILAIALLVFVFQDALDSQWNPNQQPESALSAQGKASVTLNQNRRGHYITSGTINDSPVVFLLDTGATQVSIPAHIAEQLQLESYGQYPVQTANGTVTVYRTKIDSLSIGNLYLYNVDAHINPGMQSNEILLGMSALKKVEFRQTGNQLVLQQR